MGGQVLAWDSYAGPLLRMGSQKVQIMEYRFCVPYNLTKNRLATARGLLGRSDQPSRVDQKLFYSRPLQPIVETLKNKQKFKVRQPQRAAKSKRPNAPADGSKNNGIHTTKQEEYPSRHPTTDTANSSTSRRLMGVSKSNTIQSTNQAGGPVSPPHMYHPRRPAYQPRLIPKHVAI